MTVFVKHSDTVNVKKKMFILYFVQCNIKLHLYIIIILAVGMFQVETTIPIPQKQKKNVWKT